MGAFDLRIFYDSPILVLEILVKFAMELLRRNDYLVISPRTLIGLTSAENAPVYWSQKVPSYYQDFQQ